MALEAKATQLLFRGGTSADHAAFTGRKNEVTIDEDQNLLVVHDGETPGGHRVNPVPAGGVMLWDAALALPGGWTQLGTEQVTAGAKTLIYIEVA